MELDIKAKSMSTNHNFIYSTITISILRKIIIRFFNIIFFEVINDIVI